MIYIDGSLIGEVGSIGQEGTVDNRYLVNIGIFHVITRIVGSNSRTDAIQVVAIEGTVFYPQATGSTVFHARLQNSSTHTVTAVHIVTVEIGVGHRHVNGTGGNGTTS